MLSGIRKSEDIRQVKYAAVLSYILIICNTAYGLFITPYVLSRIGGSDYGVYQTIASFSGTLMVLDLGIGTTVMRYTAKYAAEKKYEKIGNFAAMGLLESGVMAAVIIFVSTIITFLINPIYSEKFTGDELNLAKTLFVILAVNLVLVVFENVFNGIIIGCNQMIYANSIKVVALILRIILIILVLWFWRSAIGMVVVSLFITAFTILAQILFIFKSLHIKIRLTQWDGKVFLESMTYTALMFVQTIAVQANGHLDNIVIGAVIGSLAVTVYSFGIQMFNMFESLATSFSNLMLPNISKKIAEGASNADLQGVVTRVGRMQFIILGGAFAGFLTIGQEFIYLWLGEGFEDVYILSLFMMIPALFTLIENVCLSILRARNMMGFRTFSLILTALINTVITVFGTMAFGYHAAAIGTGFSIIIGSIVMMNIYYHYHIGFKVLQFYKEVTSRIAFCIIVPAIVIYFLDFILYGSWGAFLIKVVVFVVIYIALLLLYGLTEPEKRMIFGKVRKGL